MTEFLTTPQGRRIAYVKTEGQGPTIVFCGGLKSDMEGTKAIWLEDWARAQGRAYLRFDYSGHGGSSGTFEEGSIADWHQDTIAAVTALTDGPLIAVGSSMGGWQALLLARAMTDRVAGLVTIAAAPDFTEDGYWAGFSEDQKAQITAGEPVFLPSDYMEPYVVTKKMIVDGRKCLVLRDPLNLPFPTRFLQGTADTAVSTETAIRLLDHATGPDIRLTLVKDADHRFSDDTCLSLIGAAVAEVIARAG
ncbi:alpha/beta hydrolase [Loktanella sp. IMCC34160]|uniref:alpha/beta fold hydrolase n=1 Tax=Loktanella sp. IMCC34160 TaxID=2510646 RepID=UPI00101CBD05|nr:alpha/beta hydrolase [Loktanella sp. IMCC34160]RYG89317.1 alpha/beta hydrolase [Loktanella sp. IMCC34160]